MVGISLSQWSIESHITRHGVKGCYALASDEEGRWYWAAADGDLPEDSRARFRRPYSLRGEAVLAGEDWVEAATSKPSEKT